jgi:hypothetical protein
MVSRRSSLMPPIGPESKGHVSHELREVGSKKVALVDLLRDTALHSSYQRRREEGIFRSWRIVNPKSRVIYYTHQDVPADEMMSAWVNNNSDHNEATLCTQVVKNEAINGEHIPIGEPKIRMAVSLDQSKKITEYDTGLSRLTPESQLQHVNDLLETLRLIRQEEEL